MINEIGFKNYKIFKGKQVLKIRPLTILIGKNNSGKSAITKLPTLIEGSLSGNFSEPLKLENNGVELGKNFEDIIYQKNKVGFLELTLKSGNSELSVVIGKGARANDHIEILEWTFTKNQTTGFPQQNKGIN
jgi:AAA15 family ATPase/GTPase